MDRMTVTFLCVVVLMLAFLIGSITYLYNDFAKEMAYQKPFLNRPGVVTVLDQNGTEKKIYVNTMSFLGSETIICRVFNGEHANPKFSYVNFHIKEIVFTDNTERH